MCFRLHGLHARQVFNQGFNRVHNSCRMHLAFPTDEWRYQENEENGSCNHTTKLIFFRTIKVLEKEKKDQQDIPEDQNKNPRAVPRQTHNAEGQKRGDPKHIEVSTMQRIKPVCTINDRKPQDVEKRENQKLDALNQNLDIRSNSVVKNPC